MPIILLVGDCDAALGHRAKKLCPDASLLDHDTYSAYLALQSHPTQQQIFFTSAGDLPKISNAGAPLYQVIEHADQVWYHPPARWSDHCVDFNLESAQTITEYFLYIANRKKSHVHGLNLSAFQNTSYLDLQTSRHSDHSCVWLAGCSITAGVGVEPEQRYAALLARKYRLRPMVDLSRSGSSIEWQADQLLRSDIRPGDRVLWGLTSEFRSTVWSRSASQPRSLTIMDQDALRLGPADNVFDETRLFKAITACHQVANLCHKVGAELFMVPIMCTEHLQLLLHSHPDYYQLDYAPAYADFGSDGMHPGPKQHQRYADAIDEIWQQTLQPCKDNT